MAEPICPHIWSKAATQWLLPDTEEECNMKLIDKHDLRFIDGYLLDQDGEVMNLNRLAEELNELVEVFELTTFLRANATAIDEASDPVVYRPARDEDPVFEYDKEIETPLIDEQVAKAEAMADEFLKLQGGKDITSHLRRYSHLAKWFEKDYILYNQGAADVVRQFKGDILTITPVDIIKIVEDAHDPEILRLRDQVQIDFS